MVQDSGNLPTESDPYFTRRIDPAVSTTLFLFTHILSYPLPHIDRSHSLWSVRRVLNGRFISSVSHWMDIDSVSWSWEARWWNTRLLLDLWRNNVRFAGKHITSLNGYLFINKILLTNIRKFKIFIYSIGTLCCTVSF